MAREILERFSEVDIADKLTVKQPVQQQQQRPNNNIVQIRNPLNAIPNVNQILRNPPQQAILSQKPPEQLVRTMVPRPFVLQNRSNIDKILDFFICDGPNNRLTSFFKLKL